MIAKGDAGLGQRRAPGRTGQELNAEFALQSEQSAAHDRLGDTKSARGRRNASGVGDLNKCLQVLNIEHCVPLSATGQPKNIGYLHHSGNAKVYVVH